MRKSNIFLKGNKTILLVLSTHINLCINLVDLKKNRTLIFSSSKNKNFLLKNLSIYFRKITGIKELLTRDIKTMNSNVFFFKYLNSINNQSLSQSFMEHLF